MKIVNLTPHDINIINEDGNKQIEVWSNPDIIATNPKHPNGEYYPYLIEYGWIDKSGVFHQGDHMWESASTLGKNDLLNDISEEINKKVKQKVVIFCG